MNISVIEILGKNYRLSDSLMSLYALWDEQDFYDKQMKEIEDEFSKNLTFEDKLHKRKFKEKRIQMHSLMNKLNADFLKRVIPDQLMFTDKNERCEFINMLNSLSNEQLVTIYNEIIKMIPTREDE